MALHQFLAGRFSREFIKLSLWQSDMLKGHILFKHSPTCSQSSFESAAVIGEYCSSKKEIFVDLLGDPGKISRSEILGVLKELWDRKLSEFGRDPKDFFDLLMESERTRILARFGDLTRAIKYNPYSVLDTYLAEGNKKIPAISFLPYLSGTVLLEGFGGGLHYPELVRKLWRNSYEIVPDDAAIDYMVKYGVLSPGKRETVMQPKLLKERQTQLLPIVREYVSKHFPEYLELFG